MLTFAAFLIGIWFLGVMTSFTFSGFIHLLLLAAIVISLERIIAGDIQHTGTRSVWDASA